MTTSRATAETRRNWAAHMDALCHREPSNGQRRGTVDDGGVTTDSDQSQSAAAEADTAACRGIDDAQFDDVLAGGAAGARENPEI